MMKLLEHHHEKGNENNFQEREIEYSNFENYLRDIQEVDGTMKELVYPSVPRQTKIENVIITKDRIDFELTMRVNKMRVCAYTKIIEE